MGSGTAPVANWVSEIAGKWRSGNISEVRQPQVPTADGSYEFTVDAVGDADLDLASVPADSGVHVQVRNLRPASPPLITLRGLRKGASVHVLRADAHSRAERADVILASDVAGIVTVSGPDPGHTHLLTVQAETGSTGVLRLVEGRVTLAAGLPAGLEVVVSGSANLHIREDLYQLTLEPGGLLTPDTGGNEKSVDSLLIRGQVHVPLATTGNPPKVRHLRGEPGARLQLDGKGAQNNLQWTVNLAENLIIDTNTVGQLRLSSLQDCEVRGPVSVLFAAASTADGLRLTRNNSGVPTLAADAGSVLVELSGELLLGHIMRCHLAGGPRGFTIAGLSSDAASRSNPLQESVLTGFSLPGGLTGRQLLSEMTEVYQLDPDTADLPGWNYRWHLRHPLQLGPGPADGDRGSAARRTAKAQRARQLRHDAEFMRELQRLSAEKGAPGSTRTKVAWSAYRLRQLATQGRVERGALALYRLIGYGERPMPAVVLWIALAALSAAFALGWSPDFTPTGVARFASETFRQAVGPLTGLLHAGSPPLKHDRDYIFRAAVAVPLVTALLALRNYVKSR